MHKDVKIGLEYHTVKCAACNKKGTIFLTLKENRIVYLCGDCASKIGNDLVLHSTLVQGDK